MHSFPGHHSSQLGSTVRRCYGVILAAHTQMSHVPCISYRGAKVVRTQRVAPISAKEIAAPVGLHNRHSDPC